MSRKRARFETPSPGLVLSRAYEWRSWKNGQLFASLKYNKFFYDYWRGDIWWLSPPNRFDPEWLNQPNDTRIPDADFTPSTHYMLDRMMDQGLIRGVSFAPKRFVRWLEAMQPFIRTRSLFCTKMLWIDNLLDELGSGPTREEDLTEKELDSIECCLDRTIFNLAMRIHVKRMIEQMVDTKWQKKKMVFDYYYSLVMQNKLPRTELERKKAMVTMLDNYHSMERALSVTSDHWGAGVGLSQRKAIFNALGIDMHIIGGRPMTPAVFERIFLRWYINDTIPQRTSQWCNAVIERYAPLARYHSMFEPGTFSAMIYPIRRAIEKRGYDKLLDALVTGSKNVQVQICTSFCSDLKGDNNNIITVMDFIQMYDKGLIAMITKGDYVGPFHSLGYLFHFRCLACAFGMDIADAEGFRNEMELLVGRKRTANGTQLHSFNTAFSAVVKKHFKGQKGKLLSFSAIQRLSQEGSKHIFIA